MGIREQELRGAIERSSSASSARRRIAAFATLLELLIDRARSDEGLAPTLELLEREPELLARLDQAVLELWAHGNALALFAEAGMPGDRGFLAELSDRLMHKLVPPPDDDADLARLVSRVFGRAGKLDAWSALSSAECERLLAIAARLRPETVAPAKAALADALVLLAGRIAAEAHSPKLRGRSVRGGVAASPFRALWRASDRLAEASLSGVDLEAVLDLWRAARDDCRAALRQMTRENEAEGISIDIVYGLEVIERSLARLELAVGLIGGARGDDRSLALKRWVAALAAGVAEQRSLSAVIEASTRRVHRRIVERSGDTGEHYIAKNRREYRHIWLAAAGGGLLTTATAAGKLVVHGAHLAPFQEGALYGVVYACSFLLLQAFGLMLATKQPAMTAARLASIVRERGGRERLDEIVDYIARIVNSQLAAALANVTLVSLGAFAFDAAWRALLGRPFLDIDSATDTYRALSPLDSGTVIFAALTGVILWLASLAGGWFENWAVYRRVPEAIARHPAVVRIARKRGARVAGFVQHNVGGFATNVSLGFMLGMTPAIGIFLGVPLDVRHVTLSTGTLALAASALDQGWLLGGGFFRALSGIGVMFVLNLGVSFALSLFTALRAFELSGAELRGLVRRLISRLVQRPADFIWPARDGS